MIVALDNRSFIKVSGVDAEDFLQSQFSNNLKNIQKNQIQFNAYCQHQGKIIALIWVFKNKDHYCLSIPKELKEIVLSRLNIFKLMSRVEFEDLTDKFFQYGLIKEDYKNSYVINENLSILITTENRFDSHDSLEWERACIIEGIAEIFLKMSEKFIPQDLNLDINEIGVSFTKGCYPGQEVVARMHYLAKPKRRLFRFTSNFEVCIGDSLNVSDSKSLKSPGQVIRVANVDNGGFHFLGVFEVEHTKDSIFVNNDVNRLVSIIHE